jgi:phenylpropionate dioxygenase-like ring-hydroxylating dioxygenase large terminal subunit
MSLVPSLQSSQSLHTEVGGIIRDALAGSSDLVQEGRTLPPRAYVSPEFFDLEIERIFKTEWLCVGHVAQVPRVGDYFTIELFDEPMVIVRGKDRIRALSSVCRHRWAPIAKDCGHTQAFSCPFHKWTYALDGSLIGAPLMEQAAGFDKKAIRLPEFRSEVVEELGLIFVTFSESINSITERLSTLCDRATTHGWDLKDQVVVQTLHQTNLYNWKVQVETYVECYHHIGGHSESLQKIMPAGLSRCEEDKGTWTICHAGLNKNLSNLSPEERCTVAAFAKDAIAGDTLGHIVVIYPCTLVTFMKGGGDIRILSPISPGVTKSTILTTRQFAQTQAPEFSQWLAEYTATAEMVNKEDNDINLMQQIGVLSSRAAVGRFSHLEAGAWHLAQFVRRRIRE